MRITRHFLQRIPSLAKKITLYKFKKQKQKQKLTGLSDREEQGMVVFGCLSIVLDFKPPLLTCMTLKKVWVKSWLQWKGRDGTNMARNRKNSALEVGCMWAPPTAFCQDLSTGSLCPQNLPQILPPHLPSHSCFRLKWPHKHLLLVHEFWPFMTPLAVKVKTMNPFSGHSV